MGSKPDNSVGVYTVKMEAGANWIFPKTNSDANRSVFFYKGDTIKLEGKTISSHQIIELEASENIVIQNGTKLHTF